MKAGILGFSYAGFQDVAHNIATIGYHTTNLGDNAQTIAARHAWRSVGVSDEDVILIDRDTLPDYEGPAAALLMNAAFSARNLPPPNTVAPIFLGFCADQQTISQHADWLRSHSPIGCRDFKTAERCRAHGIDSFITGCVTLTLPPRTRPPELGRLFVVLGSPELLPPAVYKHVPTHLLDRVEFIFHRCAQGSYPLGIEQQRTNEALERHLHLRYRTEASLVLTPLLHVASPCAAMQVPVVLCRSNRDGRFGVMETLMPLYTPENLHEINWSPTVVDVRGFSRDYLDRLSHKFSQLKNKVT